MTLVNNSARISSSASQWTVGQIYAMHKNEKFFYDRERLQRLLNSWPVYKAASYLTTLVNGGSFKDLFQIAKIQPIVENLEKELTPFTKNPEILKDNIDYFKNLLDEGYEYIVLDGQHRISTIADFFEDKIDLNPINVIQLIDVDTNKSEYVRGIFSKLSDEVKEYIRNIPVIVTSYDTGDLRELAMIFITSNDMMPMTQHERRILNYNSLNRWLTRLCNDDPNIKEMFKITGNMSGEYSLDHKGDTLFVAEMLAYLNNNSYEGYSQSVLNDILGANPSNNIKITNGEKELAARIMRIMADGVVSVGAKKLGTFSKSTLYNLFYTMSFLMQKGNHWSSASIYGFDGQYMIDKPKEFVSWFFDKETMRLDAPGTHIYFNVPNKKKPKKQVHEWSFRKHNADQNHSSKESFEGEGGSKYSFSDWARVRYLLADLAEDLTMLVNSDIIRRVGSRTGDITRTEALVRANIPLSKFKDFEVNEIVPVSKGGNRNADNVEVLPKAQNRKLSNRPNKKVVND